MLRKILHPLYILYQVLFAWWAALIVVAITAIIISVFGHHFKVKNADHTPAVIWCRLTCWIFLIPVKVIDRDKYVKKDETYIFAANHQGMFDIFIMYGYICKRFKWIMKDSLRKMPLLGLACEQTGHIFVNRSTPQKDLLRKSISTLKGGASMGIFPEGTRCRDGKLGTFKKGAFVIANMAQKTIIPVAIQGSYDILPKGCKCLHWSPVTITFHAPVECQGRDSENVERMMNETRAALAKTRGQE